jgi:poly-gamma-glutamate synthesis protein (capsule biosynthesis protein)
MFTGDIMLDRGVRRKIDEVGIDKIFANVAPVLARADYAVVNLECPVTNLKNPQKKGFLFRAEPKWLPALAAVHITHANLANNHSIDQGSEGIRTTADSLIKDGIQPLGCGIKGTDECAPRLITAKGETIALFGCVQAPMEGWRSDSGKFSPCEDTPAQLVARVGAYKKTHPETIVIVCLHWGTEYRATGSPFQLDEAHKLINAGADAIVGHHPHVLENVEFYKHKPILYSLGNFVFDQHDPPTKRSAAAKFTIRDGRVQSIEFYPILLPDRIPSWAGKSAGSFLASYLPKATIADSCAITISYHP